MKQRIYLITCLLLPYLTITSGCGPRSKIVNDWKAPNIQPQPFTKMVAIVMGRDESMRRIAEDEFVKRLQKNTKGLAGYSLIPEVTRSNVESVKKTLKDAGVDGAAVFRLVGIDHELQYTPGTPYTSFYGYYGWAWSTTYVPDYLAVEKTVRIEASVYSLTSEKLVWSGISESTDPKSARKVIDDVVGLVVQRMQRVGFVN
jgi:hypothetical protein